MIIESGIDVVQVLCGSVSNSDPRGLWIVAMDANLRLLYIERLAGAVAGGVENHLDEIERYLDMARDAAYYALAWSTDVELRPGRGSDGSLWLRELDKRLRGRPELAGSRLLGLVVFDGSSLFASIPQCDFSLEPDFRDLPRALAIAGPHGMNCECPICAAERREMYDSYNDDSYYDDSRDYDSRDYDSRGFGSRYDDLARFDEPQFDEPQYDPIWKRWYPEPERAYKRWTIDEEATIAQSHLEGLSCFDISILVQRQPGAVASRLNKLGISSRTVVLSEAASEPEQEPAPSMPLPTQPPPDR